jgi:hypothetical protein
MLLLQFLAENLELASPKEHSIRRIGKAMDQRPPRMKS